MIHKERRKENREQSDLGMDMACTPFFQRKNKSNRNIDDQVMNSEKYTPHMPASPPVSLMLTVFYRCPSLAYIEVVSMR